MTNRISASCVGTATTLLMLGPSTGVSLSQSKSEPSGFEACAGCGTCFVVIAADPPNISDASSGPDLLSAFPCRRRPRGP